MILLTSEQMSLLAPYEERFNTAIHQSWARALPTSVLAMMHNIRLAANPRAEQKMNYACGTCVLRLLREVGQMYFDTLAEQRKPAPAQPKKTTKKK